MAGGVDQDVGGIGRGLWAQVIGIGAWWIGGQAVDEGGPEVGARHAVELGEGLEQQAFDADIIAREMGIQSLVKLLRGAGCMTARTGMGVVVDEGW